MNSRFCSLFASVFALAFAASLLNRGYAAELPPFAVPESVGMSSERLDKLRSYFNKEIADGKLPGVVIAVARRGKLVMYESLGVQDPASKAPMTKDAIFRIYSMTKPLVSVAAMQLVEEGAIQLVDPISRFLPEFAKLQVSVPKQGPDGKTTYEMAPAEKPITVQDLLRHTAGLAYAEMQKNQPVVDAYVKAGLVTNGVPDARSMTPAEQVTALAKAPLIHQPGTTFDYSMAVDLLGRVIEAVSGRRLADFLSERLFSPLKMTDAGFYVPADKLPRLAQAFETDPFTKQKFPLIDVSVPPKNDSGGAGGVATASDYLRFCQMLLNGGSLDGVRVLGQTTVRLMASDHLGNRKSGLLGPGALLLGTDEGYSFGLGFLVRTHQGLAGVHGSVGEFMWAGYGGTFFWVDPREELAVVYMSQASGPSRTHYRRSLKSLVAQAIVE